MFYTGDGALRKQMPAPLCALAIGGDMHDGLQLHVVVELAFQLAVGPQRSKVSGDARLATKHAHAGDLKLGIVSKQRYRLSPLALVDVKAIDALQVFNVVLVD